MTVSAGGGIKRQPEPLWCKPLLWYKLQSLRIGVSPEPHKSPLMTLEGMQQPPQQNMWWRGEKTQAANGKPSPTYSTLTSEVPARSIPIFRQPRGLLCAGIRLEGIPHISSVQFPSQISRVQRVRPLMFVEKPSAHTWRRWEWKCGCQVGGDGEQFQKRP